MARPKHPDWEIEDAIQYAESYGWRYRESGRSAHAWCKLRCPHHARDGCAIVVWGTSSNPGTHAKKIMSAVKNCPHFEG